MNSRILNVVLLGISLGLLGIVSYLAYLNKYRPVPVQYITQKEPITNILRQGYKVLPTNYLAKLADLPWSWDALENTNYVIYIENLRAFGCPEETVRDIIITDIAKLYTERRAAILSQLPVANYWESPDYTAYESPIYQEVQELLRQLDVEENELVEELLGVNLDIELARYSGEPIPSEFQLEFLPPEQRLEVMALLLEYDDLETEFLASLDGSLLPLDQAKLREFQKERNAELATVLSPAEMLEFKLRNSDLARSLKSNLKVFKPSEQEFQRIFELQEVLEDTISRRFDEDELRNEDIRTRVMQEAQQAFDEELQKELGEERHAEYARAQDEDYQALIEVADRYALPELQASKIYEMKVATELQRKKVTSNPVLTSEQQMMALAGIARETQKSVTQILGKDGYDAYRELGGSWIYEMPITQPNPPVPTTEVPPELALPPDVLVIPLDAVLPPPRTAPFPK